VENVSLGQTTGRGNKKKGECTNKHIKKSVFVVPFTIIKQNQTDHGMMKYINHHQHYII